MKIYIAGFFDTRIRLRKEAERLWHLGHEVISTWLNEVAKSEDMPKDVFEKKLAMKDLAEVHSTDLVIIDTLDVTPRGGREVEFGYALGRHQQKLVYVVGPVRNIFHRLADMQFENWDVCIAYMKKHHAVH